MNSLDILLIFHILALSFVDFSKRSFVLIRIGIYRAQNYLI